MGENAERFLHFGEFSHIRFIKLALVKFFEKTQFTKNGFFYKK